jgi:saccharopine dehydrogenase-like NADP-dependent oxidoreductase
MKILILGGYGNTGRALARHLLVRIKHEIVIAGRHLDLASNFAASLNDKRVSARQVDASNAVSLQESLRGMDYLLVAAPTTHFTQNVVEAAIAAGVDYLDVQLSDEKVRILRSHETQITHSGLCFTTEAGFHPGLPSAMVRYAAAHMDSLRSAHAAGYLSPGRSFPYTEAMDELMECFLNYQAQVFRNGNWTKPSSYDSHLFDFGDGIGTRRAYSMFFEELRLLPELYPSLQELGFYIAGAGWIADAIMMLAMLGLKSAPVRGLRPMGRLTWWAMTALSKPPYRVALQVDAEGLKGSRTLQVRFSVEHDDGSELTAIPVVAFLMQYDQIRSPGLHMMGHLGVPGRLFRDMENMGVRLSGTIQSGS